MALWGQDWLRQGGHSNLFGEDDLNCSADCGQRREKSITLELDRRSPRTDLGGILKRYKNYNSTQ